MIIDSHCHLDHEPMGSNLDKVVERAFKNNVKYLLSISTTNESYLRILEIIKIYKRVYGTYGIHQHETKNYKNLTRWYELLSQREAVQKGYDLLGKGEKIPSV